MALQAPYETSATHKWDFNHTPVANVSDGVGSITLTNHSATSVSTGFSGAYCYGFASASSQYMTGGTGVSTGLASGAWTVEIIASENVAASAGGDFISNWRYVDTTHYYGWNMEYYNAASYYVCAEDYSNSSTANVTVYDNHSKTANKVYHWFWTFDGTNAYKFWEVQSGVPTNTCSSTDTDKFDESQAARELDVGRRNMSTWYSYLNGKIFLIRIHNAVLTTAQMTQNYQAEQWRYSNTYTLATCSGTASSVVAPTITTESDITLTTQAATSASVAPTESFPVQTYSTTTQAATSADVAPSLATSLTYTTTTQAATSADVSPSLATSLTYTTTTQAAASASVAPTSALTVQSPTVTTQQAVSADVTVTNTFPVQNLTTTAQAATSTDVAPSLATSLTYTTTTQAATSADVSPSLEIDAAYTTITQSAAAASATPTYSLPVQSPTVVTQAAASVSVAPTETIPVQSPTTTTVAAAAIDVFPSLEIDTSFTTSTVGATSSEVLPAVEVDCALAAFTPLSANASSVLVTPSIPEIDQSISVSSVSATASMIAETTETDYSQTVSPLITESFTVAESVKADCDLSTFTPLLAYTAQITEATETDYSSAVSTLTTQANQITETFAADCNLTTLTPIIAAGNLINANEAAALVTSSIMAYTNAIAEATATDYTTTLSPLSTYGAIIEVGLQAGTSFFFVALTLSAQAAEIEAALANDCNMATFSPISSYAGSVAEAFSAGCTISTFTPLSSYAGQIPETLSAGCTVAVTPLSSYADSVAEALRADCNMVSFTPISSYINPVTETLAADCSVVAFSPLNSYTNPITETLSADCNLLTASVPAYSNAIQESTASMWSTIISPLTVTANETTVTASLVLQSIALASVNAKADSILSPLSIAYAAVLPVMCADASTILTPMATHFTASALAAHAAGEVLLSTDEALTLTALAAAGQMLNVTLWSPPWYAFINLSARDAEPTRTWPMSEVNALTLSRRRMRAAFRFRLQEKDTFSFSVREADQDDIHHSNV